MDLPDFDVMFEKVKRIEELTKEIGVMEVFLKKATADVILTVRNDPKFFVNGKVPATNLILSTYAYTGINNELIDVRNALAEKVAERDALKSELSLEKLKVEVWRTEQANERVSVV